MAKDYAKRVFTTSRTPKKKRLRVELFVIPIVAIVCVVGGYWGYTHRMAIASNETTLLTRIKAMAGHKVLEANNTVKTAKTTSKTTLTESQEPEVHFDFYDELRNIHVTVPEVSEDKAIKKVVNVSTNTHTNMNVKVHDPEAPIEKKMEKPVANYILQVGAFNDSVSAGQLRLSLLLLGFEAEVVKINSEDGDIYRVQRGPFADQSDAKKLQRQLQKKGVESVIKKS